MTDAPEQTDAERRARQERDLADAQMARYLRALEHWFARRPFRCASCGGDSWWFHGWDTVAAGDRAIQFADSFVPGRALLGSLIVDIGLLYCTTCYVTTSINLSAIVGALGDRYDDGLTAAA